MVNREFYCKNCSEKIVKRYNPFQDIEAYDPLSNEESDTFFQQNISNFTGNLKEVSRVYENCKNIDTKTLKNLMSVPEKFNMNIYFYNIDGNKSNFNTFAAELNGFKDLFSIVGLAETNIDSSQKALYNLDGYNSYYSDKLPDKNKGTGVAMYVHESFNVQQNEQISCTTLNLESLFLQLKKGKRTINAGVVYRPPNSCFDEFLSEFKHALSNLPKNTQTYIIGDFNANLLNSASDANVEAFETMFLSEGLYPVNSLVTHKRGTQKGSCIDNIFTYQIESIAYSGVISDQGTAHLPVFSLSKLDFGSVTQEKQKQTQYYSFSNKNVDSLLEILKNSHNDLIGDDPESPNFTLFLDTFTNAINTSCKLLVPRSTIRNAINNPWITDSVINSIERKQELYDQWKNTCSKNCPDGDRNFYKIFSDYRHQLKHVIKFIKHQFYGRKINEVSGDPKKTWEIINQIRGKCKKSMKPQFLINNEKIIERRVIANQFNKYFVSLAPKLNESISLKPINTFRDFLPPPIMNSMFLDDCTAEEISKIISELKNGKSSDIPISVIKKCSSIISPILAHHINFLMKIGEFPDQLKLGKITPIFKKGNEELMENYRPISTLPIFGKIFEKVIYTRLYNYFVTQGLLHKNQFGFRKNNSTSHALNFSVSHVKSALANKESLLGIFIDLSKAFDTINHNILISKLKHYGIRGPILSLLCSYLKNRKQIVSVLGETSDPLSVIYGVPQGSCLGPLLFLIYINDLGQIDTDSEIILFADDTNIFVKGKNKDAAYSKANEVLKKIHNYMTSNQLHINLDKTCYMFFSNVNPVDNTLADDPNDILEDTHNLFINNITIPRVSSIKFLGVTLNENLNWTSHIKTLAKKLSCCIGSLNQIIESLPQHLYKDLYHTLFESYLTYGISVWGGCSSKALFPIFKAQKKAMRVMFGDRARYKEKFKTCCRARPYNEQKLSSEFFIKEPSKPLFNLHGFLSLQNLYCYHSCCEVFKIFKYKCPISILDLFKFSTRSHKSLFLITPPPDGSYKYRMSSIWNSLRPILSNPDTSTPVTSVKNTLKKYLLSRQCTGEPEDWNEQNFVK